MVEAIREWLKGPMHYDAGAKLYLMYGKDHALRRIFSEPVSEFKKRKLIESLKALISTKQVKETRIAVTKEVAIKHVAVSDRRWPEPDQLDATLKALKEKWKPLFSEMMSLMSRMYDVALAGKADPAMKAQAGEMAHRILDLDDECDEIYEQRDHYLKHKKLPGEKGLMELVVDVKKIPMALISCERYVRDYKNKLRKNPGDVKAAQKLKQYEWAVAEYKKKLNLD